MKIALTGKMRSGKDTVADMFIEKGFKPYKLSMGITEVINTFFSDNVKDGNKMRNYYTTIGQSLRELDDLVWVKHTWSKIQKEPFHYICKDVIITDIRQKNEEEFLRDKGFIIIKVEAATHIRKERAMLADSDFNEKEMDHETEISVDTIEEDFCIVNEGTLMELNDKVNNLITLINNTFDLGVTE